MIIQGHQTDLAVHAAEIIASRARDNVLKKGQATIGVVGGRSVAEIFKKLKNEDFPISRCHILLLDERLVPPSDPESNFKLASEALGPAANKCLHSFCSNPVQPQQNLQAYNEILRTYGNQIDIVLVSSGEDGHIASLFPGHKALTASKPEFVLLDDAPKPPPARMTATPALISTSQTGLILFFGTGKQDALAKFFDPAVETRTCPAKLISSIPENFLLTDLNITHS